MVRTVVLEQLASCHCFTVECLHMVSTIGQGRTATVKQ